MGMDFRGLVWKRVWKKTFFGLKLGQELENRTAHPHQEFPGVPPGENVTWPSFPLSFTVHCMCTKINIFVKDSSRGIILFVKFLSVIT